jgi:hypothetical protein
VFVSVFFYRWLPVQVRYRVTTQQDKTQQTQHNKHNTIFVDARNASSAKMDSLEVLHTSPHQECLGPE